MNVPLFYGKRVYDVSGYPDRIIKYFGIDITTAKAQNELRLHQIGAALGISPKIHDTNINQVPQPAPEDYYIIMERVHGLTVADYYGEDIPDAVWNEIRRLLRILLENGVEYIDISPYNFMVCEATEKIYVIDYGHAREINWFLREFLEGAKAWNPDFT